MPTSTVLLDAGGVILDESEHEAVRAEIAVEVLGAVVPGYSVADYPSDIDEAVESFSTATYETCFLEASET